ncbi:penicillin acylase family protein [Psychroflexus sp. YR1-1]|uniref:Penicillin acylase family protein n=1 Tax=Psychroflexus aurantiacus TaxID=2709310 RepID=A0A6B3R2B0_9FLAO|nr:penicillin acylase family protein [Psychroflexus aurantiacus]NEV92785.1 penicillin acylase family protein [Psychroflexus aurantiacus]
MKKYILSTLIVLVLLLIGGSIYFSSLNTFKRTGVFKISKNDFPIQIHRDEHGIAYIIAETKADVFRGQGFVMAQDRLFQIEFYRALIKGEGASLVGNSMLQSDIKMRVLDLVGNAKRHYQYLDQETKQTLAWYCEGFNDYLKAGRDEFPLELSLLDIEPSPLTPEEILSVTHFVGLFHSQNMEDEILSLNLASRTDLASKLLPLSISLDRTKALDFSTDSTLINSFNNKTAFQQARDPFMANPKLGSNNWAVSGEKSASGKPILANDPHVDSRLLPGMFYPVGLFCPEFKAVGIATPGIPGLLSGRNEFVSFGVTNAYGDSQDLFIERTDGDFYMLKDEKTAFTTRTETIQVKDSASVELEIRSTQNGPVISDFAAFNILTDDVVSLRWSLAETKSSSIGFESLLETKNAFEFKEALKGMDNMFFNYAIADVEGNIMHQATGLVPIRKKGKGKIPSEANQGDTWSGFIPKDSLPHMVNPERGWIGTANHDTRPDDYPYYYSSHFSPYYRYQRIKEALSKRKLFTAKDFWELILDVKNKQAELLTPLFISALKQDKSTRKLASLLEEWDYNEGIDSVGAAVYNVLYNQLLYLVMNDELPDDLENMYWENVYYWNQRVDDFILSQHEFIDNKNTAEVETRTELILQAGFKTRALLSERLGENQDDWTWGRIHSIHFVSPLRPEGFGSDLLGAELWPKAGSNQTLNRGAFVKTKDFEFETSWFSSFRMVADMNDDEKIMGILAGGSSARVFHPYYKSQLETWKSEEWIPYWISRKKVLEHSRFQLTLD